MIGHVWDFLHNHPGASPETCVVLVLLFIAVPREIDVSRRVQ
jgi:hypothetical protein